MAEELKSKYQIQQKTATGMLVLHPETEGSIVEVTPVTNKFTSTNVQAALEEIGEKVSQAVAGGVTDVKVDGTSVVTNNVANIDLSGKVDTETGKSLIGRYFS